MSGREVLAYILREIASPVKRHAYDYLKSETASSSLVLSSALATCFDSEPEHTIVVGLVNPPQDAVHTPGADYKYFLASDDTDFKQIFRMTRNTMYELTAVITTRSSTEPTLFVEKKVHLTVWLMGNRESFDTAAVMFGLNNCITTRIFQDMCYELTLLAGKYIQWPSSKECAEISTTFTATHGFPGVIGVIGHMLIKIKVPDGTKDRKQFWNEELQHYAIILQVVVDNRMLIRDVSAGFSGSVSFVQAFLRSPLYPRLTNPHDPLIHKDQHLLGASIYPQLPNLLTPFAYDTNQRTITHDEDDFNQLHATASMVLERTFRLLKARFQRISAIEVPRLEMANKVVIAACVLHNFAILHNDTFP